MWRKLHYFNCLFFPEEIIRAAAKDEQELKGLLHDTKRSDITETCFDEALIEACLRGNFNAACMLLVAGAQKIEESICISVRNGYYKISTLLLVCFATLKGDVTVLEMLLDKPSLERYEWLQEFVDESVPIGLVVESIRQVIPNSFSQGPEAGEESGGGGGGGGLFSV